MNRSHVNTCQRRRNIKLASFKSKRKKTIQEHLSKGVIRRLARRGGVRRLSALIYDETREVLKKYLGGLIRHSLTYCEYFNRKIVQTEDVVRALKNRGKMLYGFDEPSLPISIRSTIVLTDTVSTSEESIFSPLESTVTRATEFSKDSEVLKENMATTSRLSENLSDSDAALSDIAMPVKRNRRSNLISENGGENIKTSMTRTSANREFVNVTKTISRNSEVPVYGSLSGISKSGVTKTHKELSLIERRKLILYKLRSTAEKLRNAGAVMANTDKSTILTVNPSDSEMH